GSGVQLTSNQIYDGQVQNLDHSVSGNSFSIGALLYPWGFSLGYLTSNSEKQVYEIPSLGKEIEPEVSTGELRFSLARVFFKNRLALGGSLIFAQAVEEIQSPEPALNGQLTDAFAFGITLG